MTKKLLILLSFILLTACDNYTMRFPKIKADDLSITTSMNTPVAFNLKASETNGTYEVITQPANGVITQVDSSDSVTFTPALNFVGTTSFTYKFKVNNKRLVSNVATVLITVTNSSTPPNTAPVVTNSTPPSFNEDTQSVINLAYTDAELDMATSCALTSLVNVTVTQACSCAAGVCTVGVTGTLNYNGVASFNYTVSDPDISNSATASLTINAVNDAPVMTDESISTSKNLPVSGTFVGTDIEGDTLTYSRVTDGANGSVTLNSDGTYTYQPTASFSGSDSFTIKANDGTVDSNTVTISVTIDATLTCPTNYLKIAANTDLGTSEFCVMQYEAKNSSGTPASLPAGSPWINITATNAKSACTGLGVGHDLIANREWMAIAYLIEAQTSNWSSGTVGTGVMSLGHTDSSTGLLSVSDTTDYYDQTGNSAMSGWAQKRAFSISNTEVIWDFSGNAWEWADWTAGGALDRGFTSCPSETWLEYVEISSECTPSPSVLDYLPKNPANATSGAYGGYGTAFNLGKAYVTNNATRGFAARGGGFTDAGNAGIYTLALDSANNAGDPYVGFRCVFR